MKQYLSWQLPRIRDGEKVPRGWGCVRRCFLMNETIIAPMPFNLVLRALDWVGYFIHIHVRKAEWLDSPYHYAYREGRIQGYHSARNDRVPKDYEV
jgi:hypothetical protein